MSPAEDRVEVEATAYLDSVIRLHGPRVGSLDELCRRAQGAYPTDVLHAAKRIDVEHPGLIDPGVFTHTPRTLPLLAVVNSALPLPHPLDFEWRFSGEGCQMLIEEVSLATPPSGELALLGAPNLAEQFPRFRPNVHPTLFERRREPCEILSATAPVVPGDVALTWPAQAGRFAAVIADPPWYPAITEQFVEAAAGLLQPAGILLLCVPGLTTRPGIPAERQQIVRHAHHAGLVLEALTPGAVRYESPPFEIAALAAAGLAGFDPFWRTGDLLRFRRNSADAFPSHHPADTQSASVDEWEEARIGRAIIRINVVAQPTNVNAVLDSVVVGDVLDSVSSRDHRRSSANVWTTTNRVFTTAKPLELHHALQRRDNIPDDSEGLEAAVQRVIGEELRLLAELGIE